jgi:alkanesulfonate monooxygenase SsuD/methylene tetrahydromethanopterin reductase-like flavin-dependent oxidoreductase (luciferase family)
MSGGRAVLGVGIGDLEREFAQLGLARPSVRERQEALEEAVGIIRRLWAGEEVTVAGRHFRTAGAVLDPGPVQRPHLPLLLAGGGERVTLRQVARFADASNFGPGTATGGAFTVADVRRKVAALAAHCAAAGRPAAAVLRTYFALVGDLRAGAPVGPRRTVSRTGLAYEYFDGPPEAVVAHYRGLVRAGVRYFILATADPARVRLLAEEALPQVAAA